FQKLRRSLLVTGIIVAALGGSTGITGGVIMQVKNNDAVHVQRTAIAGWLHDEYRITATADDVANMLGYRGSLFAATATKSTVFTEYDGTFVEIGIVDVAGDRVTAIQYGNDDTAGVPLESVR